MLGIAISKLGKVSKTPKKGTLKLTGKDHFEEMKFWLEKNLSKGFLTKHDKTVGTEIARIVTGGECAEGTLITEQELFDAERESFLRLAKSPQTQARIVSMLDLGQTTRN